MILSNMKKSSRIIAAVLIILFSVSGITYSIYLATFLIKSYNNPIVLIIGNEKLKADGIDPRFDIVNEFEDKLIILNGWIDRKILLNEAKKLNIGISSIDINRNYKERIEALKKNKKLADATEESLALSLVNRVPYGNLVDIRSSNFSIALKKSIRDDLTLEALEKKVSKVSNYNEWTSEIVKNTKVVFLGEKYQKYQKKPILSLENLDVLNTEFYSNVFHLNRMLSFLNNSKKASVYLGADIDPSASDSDKKKVIYKKVYKDLALKLFIANEALKKGIKIENKSNELYELGNRLYNSVLDSTEYSEKDLTTYLNKNKKDYEEKEKLYANILELHIKPSIKDLKTYKEKAEKVLSESISNKCIQNGSSMNYEEFKTKFNIALDKEGIYDQIISYNEEFYIVEKLQDENVNYINIPVEISKETKEESLKKYKKIFDDLKSGKSKIEDKFEELKSSQDNLEKGPIYKDSKMNKILVEKLFSTKELLFIEENNKIYIAYRTKYYPNKIPSLNEVREKVVESFKNDKLSKFKESLEREFINSNSIKILEPELKNTIEN